MTSTKPRIIKRNGVWIVAGGWSVWLSGIVSFVPLGEGSTPKQAWDNAFPKPWWKRVPSDAGKKLFDVLMDKRIKEANARYNKLPHL